MKPSAFNDPNEPEARTSSALAVVHTSTYNWGPQRADDDLIF